MENDDPIDRLLRRTAGAQERAATADACLDADTLAAWADRGLTAAERAAAEAHAADCDRCLAVLAAIAKTSPPPSAPQTSWFSLRWLVPLTTAAVAITTWVVIQEPRPNSPPGDTQAAEETQKKQSELDLPQLSSGREPEAESRKPRAAERDSGARAQETLAKRETAPPALSRDSAAANRSRDAEDKAPARLDELKSLPGRAAPAPAAPAAKPRTEMADQRQEFRAAAEIESIVIASPDPTVRWRLIGTTLERTTDGGRTWTAQPTNTTGELRAGSAPTPEVCWVVGRSGLVLLTTDGQTWRQIDSPDPGADLVAVAALNASTATVTAGDGRTYRTTDGGRTWTLQEIPAAPF